MLVSCKDVSGTYHKQLLKSRDDGSFDARREAVVAQLLGRASTLLAADADCRRRSLRVPSYAAVALAPDAAVIEWLGHAQSALSWLEGEAARAVAAGARALGVEDGEALLEAAQPTMARRRRPAGRSRRRAGGARSTRRRRGGAERRGRR